MTAGLAASLVSLALLWGIAVVMSGPNFIAVFHVAANRGRRPAVDVALGCLAGTAVWAVTGVFGLQLLASTLQVAMSILKVLGAAYLVWTGIALWRDRAGASVRPVSAPGNAFRFGLVTTLANPKTAAFAASLFSVALPDGAPAWFAVAVLATILTISGVYYTALAALLSLPVFARGYAGAKGLIRKLAGTAFVGYGISVAADA